ncbi:hypothetical protein [Actinomadura sp. DC4]|uniref:hypothetical protein n=1 Tax=Actinomadura sp. DC4 TaxID=3055069 RepID=UPI0025AFA7BC|nr:hypothetical protein [Actinomadura sp. DC4]MDN3352408.1 hypothetical protein [Actinomadura sp. DC4]
MFTTSSAHATAARRMSTVVVGLAIILGFAAAGASAVFAATGGTLASLTISPHTVDGGTPAQGALTLTAAAADDTVVSLSSTDTTAATVPASVTIPAGATTATFAVTTFRFDGPGEFACVNATAGTTQTDCLNIFPPPSGPAVTSVTFSPATVVGTAGDTATVTMASAPSGGRVVTLTSSNPAVASVPSEVVVVDGTRSTVFAVVTTAVTTATPVTITASADGTTATGTLTVTPGTPPAPDVVRVTKATWNRRLLTVQATSTNPNAILSVLDSQGGFMFTLTNTGGGRYQDQRGWLDNPLNITVRSNFGGASSSAVRS